MIRLEKITPDNWRSGLRVSEAQKSFVADSAVLLARAYAYRESRSNAFIICNDDTPVGMALYYDCEELGVFDLSQFFIDERYQGKGYGFEAMEVILDMMKEDGKYNRVELCYIEGNDAARKLYEKLGFSLTGDCEDDEIVMGMMLR
ncbi:MAG: GNAT family N-acetyltransferase [Ruminococcaceae bacterium]|nr:GNAT family N-acetyltransferase [Oscillospiraceae bacterium]